MQTMIFKAEIQTAQLRQSDIEAQKKEYFSRGGTIKKGNPIKIKPAKALKVGINTDNYFQLH